MIKRILFSGILATTLLASCSNDFEVSAPWKDIPVVYGLLDITDTAHYIRVERAFLDPDGDALEIAKITDSLYYQNATVQLERVSNGQLFTMQRVNGKDWGFPREEGVFANEPNWLFRIDSSELLLKPGEIIRLRIDRGNGLQEVTSSTSILGPLKLNSPSSGSNGFTFNSDGFSSTNIGWEAPDSATIFDATLYFRYIEYPISNPTDQELKIIAWPWARGLRRESSNKQFSAEKVGLEFYQLLKNNIEVNPDVKRIFNGIDVEIIAGNSTVENLVNVSLANTGITASQEIPSYNNLSEGQGIFGSVVKFRRNGVGINDKTRDTLKMGYLTKNLNF